MEYRAISLHQPWASLVALGIKKYETRSWATKYRGKLLVCSAKKKYIPDSCLVNQVFDLTDMGTFHRTRLDFLGNNTKYTQFLPLGRVVCVVNLVDCHIMTTDGKSIKAEGRDVPQLEQLCGDWTPGRYAWELANLIPFHKPIPIKGKQGLWIPDNSTIEEVEKQIG